MTRPAFWMVCRSPRHLGARTEPKQRYQTEADAIRAATDLAAEHGHPFVVLAVTHTVWPKAASQPSLL